MAKDAVYIRCKDITTGEEVPDAVSFEYFGGQTNDGYLDSKYFPYSGKTNQPNYQSPIVAVKVNGLKVPKIFEILNENFFLTPNFQDGEKHRIRCHAIAKNIVIDDRDNLGSISFQVIFLVFRR